MIRSASHINSRWTGATPSASLGKTEKLDDAVVAARGVAAINSDRLTGDERGIRGHQERRHGCHLFRLPPAPEGVFLGDGTQRLFHAFETHDAVEHRSVDETGADRVRPDPARPVVERNVLGEQHNSALGGIVCAAARGAFETLDTGECHDRAALAVHPGLFDHSGHCRLGDKERAGEVDCDHSLPFGTVEQMDRPATCDTRGMDNAVESTWY